MTTEPKAPLSNYVQELGKSNSNHARRPAEKKWNLSPSVPPTSVSPKLRLCCCSSMSGGCDSICFSVSSEVMRIPRYAAYFRIWCVGVLCSTACALPQHLTAFWTWRCCAAKRGRPPLSVFIRPPSTYVVRQSLTTEASPFNSFLTITGKSRSWQELFSAFMVHVDVIRNLQKRCTSLWGRYREKAFRRWRFCKLAK